MSFARRRLAPGLTPAAVREVFAEAGALGVFEACAPGLRGREAGALTSVVIMEALGHGTSDLGIVFALAAHTFACAVPALRFASTDATRDAADRLRRGVAIGANAITEGDAGSDVYAMTTSARRDGDDYVLSGVKAYVSNAAHADEILVYAKTDPDGGHLGVSAFLVARETPGVRVGKPIEKLGLDGASLASVAFEDCRVPAERRLGAEGAGDAIFRLSMLWERTCLFGAYVGRMEAELDRCVAYARERRQFGRAIGKNQAVAHKLANMKLRLESARLLLYRAAWALENTDDPALAISLAKLAVADAAVESGLDAIQLHGGLGYLREGGIEQGLRDAVGARIFSGTSEIQRDLVASRLGL